MVAKLPKSFECVSGWLIYKVFEHKKFSHSVTNPIGADGKFVQTTELPTTVVH